MSKKSKFDYFKAFERQAVIACEEADVLLETIESFTFAKDLPPVLAQAHEIEHRGDELNHEIFKNVASDFITPIDREDIIKLSQLLDDVTDKIENILQCFYMYDIQFMHEDTRKMATYIKKSTKALRRAMGDFNNFKKSKKFNELILNINDYEEQADELFLQTTRDLYTIHRDHPVRIEVWSRIFDRMEQSCDACEEVADFMSTIVLKNS